MAKTKIGIRNFRSKLTDHIASGNPVTVTSHGEAVGVFIPTEGETDAVAAALKKASAEFDRLRAARPMDTDAFVAVLTATHRLGEATDSAGRRLEP